jgi:acetyl-CoA carboxylase biotin carboxyl carrier protein
MTLDEIRELINLVTQTGVAELEVQRGADRVRILRALSSQQEVVVSAPAPVQTTVSAPPPNPRPATAEAPATPPGADPTLHLVKSPIVGTFYEASAPGAPPFVRMGERVQPGKVLCIIESMKLMNEIEAEVTGVIESKFVANGQPVEYGEALFAIRAF